MQYSVGAEAFQSPPQDPKVKIDGPPIHLCREFLEIRDEEECGLSAPFLSGNISVF
jgi:hypothetical protein